MQAAQRKKIHRLTGPHLSDRVGRTAHQFLGGGDPDRDRPLFTAVLALWLIRSEAPGRKQFAGLVIGFAGVIALLGIDFRGSPVELAAAGAVLLSALGYAGAALVYRRWLADVPAIGVTALMTAISSLAFLAPAAVNLPREVPGPAASSRSSRSGSSTPASPTGCFTC